MNVRILEKPAQQVLAPAKPTSRVHFGSKSNLYRYVNLNNVKRKVKPEHLQHSCDKTCSGKAFIASAHHQLGIVASERGRMRSFEVDVPPARVLRRWETLTRTCTYLLDAVRKGDTPNKCIGLKHDDVKCQTSEFELKKETSGRPLTGQYLSLSGNALMNTFASFYLPSRR